MKLAMQLIGIVVAMLIAAIVFSRMSHSYVAWLSLLSFGMAAWVAGPEALKVAQLFRETLDDLHISIKEVAIATNMTDAQVSRQLACVDQLSMSRWSELGPRFLCGLALRVLREDGRYTIVENGLLARMVNRMEDIFEATSRATDRRVA